MQTWKGMWRGFIHSSKNSELDTSCRMDLDCISWSLVNGFGFWCQCLQATSTCIVNCNLLTKWNRGTRLWFIIQNLHYRWVTMKDYLLGCYRLIKITMLLNSASLSNGLKIISILLGPRHWSNLHITYMQFKAIMLQLVRRSPVFMLIFWSVDKLGP